MTTARIPRAEANAICEKHGDFWGLTEDPPAEVVRHVADDYRTSDEYDPARVAIAADLDALVDRIERGWGR
jgi:hypothetical protein